jgi:hypothetical protein
VHTDLSDTIFGKEVVFSSNHTVPVRDSTLGIILAASHSPVIQARAVPQNTFGNPVIRSDQQNFESSALEEPPDAGRKDVHGVVYIGESVFLSLPNWQKSCIGR